MEVVREARNAKLLSAPPTSVEADRLVTCALDVELPRGAPDVPSDQPQAQALLKADVTAESPAWQLAHPLALALD